MSKKTVNIKLVVATVINGTIRLPGSIIENMPESDAKNLLYRGRAVLHGDDSNMNSDDPAKGNAADAGDAGKQEDAASAGGNEDGKPEDEKGADAKADDPATATPAPAHAKSADAGKPAAAGKNPAKNQAKK